jgi:hypothetical protein
MRPCSRYHPFRVFALCCLFGAFNLLPAHASISILLEEPYGWFSHISPSGHTAIYLDHVCADTPLHLRLCRPGELGVVISRYNGIGNHDWIAVPLTGYLYAVQSPDEIPSYVTATDIARLREAYRQQMLLPVAPTLSDGTAPAGNWYELAGAAFDRTIYGFEVKTTHAQDVDLISHLNDTANHEKFNGIYRNCADFVRVTVDRFYPHAIGRNYIAGFGVTSPKSVARSLSHYAKKHPETELRTFRITQVPGTRPRSHPAVTLMEGISKEFGIPLIVASPFACPMVCPIAAGALVTAWLTQGRLAEPKTAPELNLISQPSSQESSPPPQDSANSTFP